MINFLYLPLATLLLALPLIRLLLGRRAGWGEARGREWVAIAGGAGALLMAPSPWALLPVLAAGAGILRPQWPVILVGATAPLLALLGLIFLPGASLARERADAKMMDRAGGKSTIATLKSELRNNATIMETAYAEDGRYDAILLVDYSSGLAGYIGFAFAPEATTYHVWAWRIGGMWSPIACDLDRDPGTPSCPARAPLPSPLLTPRIFSAEWVRDSSAGAGWLARLQSLPPNRFATDTLLPLSDVRTTVLPTGWLAERDAYNWTCSTGSGSLAPEGVEPGGVICRAKDVGLTSDPGGDHQH